MISWHSPRGLVWLCTGLLLGVGFRLAIAAGKPAPTNPNSNPNVVVLRSARRVTLEAPRMTWSDLAKELKRQTGYAFTVDPRFERDQTTCAYLMKGAPLPRVLDLTAYLSGGVWERKASDYHLRPKTAEEIEADVDRYHALLMMAKDYVDKVPNDSLDSQQQMARDSLDRYMPKFYDLSGQPGPWMNDWKVTLTDRGISLIRSQETKVGNHETKSFDYIGGAW